jgi:hypothetical protein
MHALFLAEQGIGFGAGRGGGTGKRQGVYWDDVNVAGAHETSHMNKCSYDEYESGSGLCQALEILSPGTAWCDQTAQRNG